MSYAPTSNLGVPSLKCIAIRTVASHSEYFAGFGSTPQHLAQNILQTVFDSNTITATVLADFAESYPHCTVDLRHMRWLTHNKRHFPPSFTYLDRQLRSLAVVPQFITRMDLSNCSDLDDHCMHRLNLLKNLETLVLTGTEISDAGISQLSLPLDIQTSPALRRLRVLMIQNIYNITDASLKYLVRFPALEAVDMSDCHVDKQVAETVLTRLGYTPVNRWNDHVENLVRVRSHYNLDAFLIQPADIAEDRKLYWATHSSDQVPQSDIQTMRKPATGKYQAINVQLKFYRQEPLVWHDKQCKRPAAGQLSGPLKVRKAHSTLSLEDILKSL
ncbi:hypothetical protein INT43_004532 [Umbelopsis isabellina]|uniref:Uncharacterized protein n=1 Tax=Mortierella isabellina TaxID=91625 RepID=A0A8H7PFT2_MORIS|nr:hypothetical protein INT43_004532 [Umbelopsis isabellina]